MPKTAKGIYHDLRESKYSISIDDIEYFFSSKLYRDKFERELQRNRDKYDWFFNGKKLNLNFNTLADISLYVIVEKRGFRVKVKECSVNWQMLRNEAVARLNLKEKADRQHTRI
jgi:hypothetical protein